MPESYAIGYKGETKKNSRWGSHMSWSKLQASKNEKKSSGPTFVRNYERPKPSGYNVAAIIISIQPARAKKTLKEKWVAPVALATAK